MYAVVKYNDYYKEQNFEFILTTTDVEYAKKAAFHYAKKYMHKYTDDCYYIHKITSNRANDYLQPINDTIISYKIIGVKPYKKGDIIEVGYSCVHAVIKFNDQVSQENIEEIDTTLICNNYYEDEKDYEDKNEDEDEDNK